MARSLFILVSDDYNEIHKARTWASENGVTLNVYSGSQWTNGLEDKSFRSQLYTEELTLQAGNTGVVGGKVLNFPSRAELDKKVHTINEVEKEAIEKAIFEFRGNLTEAAKALGIGRATLYRKVKQYQIDPSQARKRTSRAA